MQSVSANTRNYLFLATAVLVDRKLVALLFSTCLKAKNSSPQLMVKQHEPKRSQLTMAQSLIRAETGCLWLLHIAVYTENSLASLRRMIEIWLAT